MTDHTHDLERVFSHRAFIPFVTCGDPDIETTEGLVRAMAEAGADLIELGIPFSDPIAEGPVQGAVLWSHHRRHLRHGRTRAR